MTQDIVVEDFRVIGDTIQGKLFVVAGGIANIRGTFQGTVEVENGGRVEIPGTLQGTLTLDEGAEVIVTGDAQGTIDIADGARLVVEPSGRVAGVFSNGGEFINRGLRAGIVDGNDPVDEGGKDLPPEVAPDGTVNYNMPPR